MTFKKFLSLVTDAGDSSVLLGIVVTAALYFFLCRDNREAMAIFLSLVISSALIAGLKIGFLTCGNGYLDIRSPSGHSALSIAVYGMYPFILRSHVSRKISILLFVLFFGLASGIVISRVVLHMHSPNEAIIGFIVGLTTIGLINYFVLKGKAGGSLSPPRFNFLILIGLTVAVLFTLHGSRLPAEKAIGKIAQFLRNDLSICSN